MHNPHGGRVLKRVISLDKAYILVFTILAAWAFVAFFTMHSLIKSQEQYGKLINLSGKQRMLSQKTTLMAKRYFESSDERFYEDLKALYKQMRQDHDFIMENLSSKEIAKLYKEDGLDGRVRDYFKLIEGFLESSSSSKIELLQENSYELLPFLDKAVYAFEKESSEKIKSLQQREFFILIGTLSTLLLEIIFLVRPVVKFVNTKNKNLQKIIKEKAKNLEIYARIFENAVEGMMIADKDGTIIAVNKAFSSITGYGQNEVLGKKPSLLKSGKHDSEFYQQMWQSLQDKGSWQGENINTTKNGRNIYEWLSIIRYEEEGADNCYYISVFYDITEQHEAKAHLEYVATHDFLTKLPNRNLFNDRLEQAIVYAKKRDSKVALVFLDLDNFKSINDTLGHDSGDEYLQKIAKRLEESIVYGDTVARVGGDEFVIIVRDFNDIESLSSYLKSILEKVSEDVDIEGNLLQTTASIGVSLYPDDARTTKELFQFADTAMYHAKESGKNSFSFFTQTLNERIKRRLEIDQHLKNALDNDEFELFIQPKIDLLAQKVSGGEALIRWRKNPALGTVNPDQFIPIAEESHQIHLISKWVCSKASSYLERWEDDEILGDLSLAVNISPKEFLHRTYIKSLVEFLRNCPFAHKFVIEITENMLLDDLQSAVDILHSIHESGSKIAIDDFGSGYSSLGYLQKLPLDNLKVDKSFVLNLSLRTDGPIIVKAIVTLAHSLGLSVVAEGVETKEQLDFMHSLGCEEIQGYFYAPAMPLEEFETWVREFNGRQD